MGAWCSKQWTCVAMHWHKTPCLGHHHPLPQPRVACPLHLHLHPSLTPNYTIPSNPISTKDPHPIQPLTPASLVPAAIPDSALSNRLSVSDDT